jgi:diketogulonate reductase-like aldo/keto reductase
MKTVLLPDGHTLPALGLGTWRMGEAAGARAAEVAAVRRAFEIGYRVIDTAEMYGGGGAESVVGEALSMRFGPAACAAKTSSLLARSIPTTPAGRRPRRL